MLVTDLDHFLDLSEDTPGAARRLAEHLSHAALLGVPRTTVYGHLNRAADGAASGQVHDLGRDDRGGSAGHAPAAAVAHAE